MSKRSKAHAISVRHVDGRLCLFLRVVRAPSGIYVVFAAGQDRPGIPGKAYDPHSSWHRAGRVHEKSYDRAWIWRDGQRLDSFEGAEPFVATSVDQASAAGLPLCDPTQFASVMEVPVSLLDVTPSGHQFQIDLVGPGAAQTAPGFAHRALRRWFLSDGVPTIVVSFYELDLLAPAAEPVAVSKKVGAPLTQEQRLEGKITMHGRLVVKKISSDGSDAIRVADDQGQSVTADLTPDGEASYEIAGRSRQGEEGALEVCQILAQRLRRDNAGVGEPRRATGPERGIDCEIPINDEILQVQVTRPATPDFWQKLNRDGTAERDMSLTDAEDDLLALVGTKARKTSPTDRAKVVLAFDATETAVHAMHLVVQAVRKRPGADIARYGFKAVWIIGPTDDLVFRVDEGSG